MRHPLSVFVSAMHLALAGLLGLQTVSFAQTAPPTQTPAEGSSSRAFHAFTSTGPRRFESDSEAQGVVDKIVRFVPSRNAIKAFVTDDPATVPNAEARMSADKQHIVSFNRAFMREIQAKAGNYWSLFGIAAHEIGHHVGNHTFLPMDNCKLNNEVELEADYYAGFALGKMDVKRDDAVSTLRTLPANSSCSHPGRAERILVLVQGWTQASAGSAPQTSPAAAAAAVTATTSPAKTAPDAFKIRLNRDVFGHDIDKASGLTQDGCAARCEKNAKCKGFSFDRWNGWCFLKDAMTNSQLDPAAVIAVRAADPFPSVATTPFDIYRLRRKKFNDQAFSSTPAASYEACQAQCSEAIACVAYTFAKTTTVCQLFKETVGYFYDENFDSGFKHQRTVPASAAATPAAAPAAGTPSAPAQTASLRIEIEKGRYFKGDGYAKIEDKVLRDCEGLCLRDSRCQALEHIDKERVCRLYAKSEPAIPTPGTTVGYKRAK